MQRITMSMDDELAGELDEHMKQNRYGSRSEAMRDIMRERFARDRIKTAAREEAGSYCVGTLTYIYDHQTRALGQRLTQAQHDHHDLQVSTLHVHLDHETCLEVSVLRGRPAQVRAFGNETLSQRGVRYGHLHLMPATLGTRRHSHGGPPHDHEHIEV